MVGVVLAVRVEVQGRHSFGLSICFDVVGCQVPSRTRLSPSCADAVPGYSYSAWHSSAYEAGRHRHTRPLRRRAVFVWVMGSRFFSLPVCLACPAGSSKYLLFRLGGSQMLMRATVADRRFAA